MQPQENNRIHKNVHGRNMTPMTQEIQKRLVAMAISESHKKGGGILMVEQDKPPIYVQSADVTPVSFRQSVTKMNKEEGDTHCFMGFVDNGHIHVIKALKNTEDTQAFLSL